MDLKELGFSKEEILEKVVEKVVADLMADKVHGPDEEEYEVASPFRKLLEEEVRARLDAGIKAVADKTIVKDVESLVENMLIQKTNTWGEKKGEPVTIREYLIQRAGEYLSEPVNNQGESQSERRARGYSDWSQQSTRLVSMVDRYLAYRVQSWAEEAIKAVTGSMGTSLEAALRASLEDVSKKIKVAVSTK